MTYSATDAAIGHRLRAIREANGLSQRELARRAGVTNSSISMIEQGQVSPSISSLEKILAVFPLSLGYFFSVDFNAPAAVFFKAASTEVTAGSPWQQFECSAPSASAGVVLKQLHLPVFVDDASVISLTATVAQVVWILAGRVQVSARELVRELGVDEGLSLSAYSPCTLCNHGETRATVMIAAELPQREL